MILSKANNPVISIIMSVYNETYDSINVAVNSILQQTFNDFELILVNDNPTSKDTRKAIREILKKDKRIKIIENDRNRGLGYALNAAIRQSCGNIIARMDTEDKSLPQRLAKQISFMKKHIEVDLLFTQWIDVNEHEEAVVRQPSKKDFINIRKSFFIKSLLMHPTLMARKKVLIDNPYQEMGRPEDIVLWLKLIRKEYLFDVIEEPLYIYRIDRINVLQRCEKTKKSSTNLLPHLVRESKYYWTNIYFWLFFGRTIFEYFISKNVILFNYTHSRAAWLWKYFFEPKKNK